MKIVLCNKFYFISGGTDRYMFELMEELKNTGHIPIPFSIKHALSKPSEYDMYFLPPPSSPEQVFYSQIKFRNANLLRLLGRSTYSFEAQRYLRKLIMEQGPIDIGYILNIYNYMSPSIIRTFKIFNIPVVHMVGDYNLQCPAYLFLRKGKPCTMCINSQFYHALFYKCVKNSLMATFIRVFSMYLYKTIKIYQNVDTFIVPCDFMRQTLIKGGYPSEKIRLIKYPVKLLDSSNEEVVKKNYILYFGRISYEKGLDILVHAFLELVKSHDVDLVILGRDYDGERDRLSKLIPDPVKNRIRFEDFMEGRKLSQFISKALFTIVPSRWYDNTPFSIYESYLHGTPVVGAKIGGIPEQIEDSVTGKLFEPESTHSLLEAMKWMLQDKQRLVRMGKLGRKRVLEENSYERHLMDLLGLFHELKNKKARYK